MADYNNYTYSKLLRFLHEGYQKYPQLGNFADLLLSMKESNSINAMIDIYNRVIYMIPYYLYGPNDIPKDWFIYENWKDRSNYFAFELNRCLNENIIRLYNATPNPTELFRRSCLANIRHCQHMNIQELVIDDANIRDKADEIRKAKYGLIDRRHLFYTPTQVKYSDKELTQLYNQDMDVLLNNGYVKTIVDKQYEDANNLSKKRNLFNNQYFLIAFIIIMAIIITIPLMCFLDSLGFVGLMVLLGIPGYFLSGAWKK
ncbi:MAG: hypothetical protein IKO33_10475 [Bacteroidaceae bacterium]|nr:hypothetical protein [Bacteroidaceae bacterium]